MVRAGVVVAAVVALALVGSAGAKGPVVADVCGAWDCLTLRGGAATPLSSWWYTPFVELGAPKPSRYYSIRFYAGGTKITVLYVPSRALARITQHDSPPYGTQIGPYWRSVPADARPALNRIVDKLQAVATPARWPRNEDLPPACRANVANGNVPPGAPKSFFGNGRLATYPYRVVFADGRTVNADGTISEKFPWYGAPGVRGELTITGRRLHPAGAVRLRAHVNAGYVPGSPPGARFWSSGITFPTGGCWKVVGRAGRDSLAIVVNVEPVGGTR